MKKIWQLIGNTSDYEYVGEVHEILSTIFHLPLESPCVDPTWWIILFSTVANY
jgi:hypothetical protein